MSKKFLSICALSFGLAALTAQVGIQTQNPQGIFNIDGGKNNSLTGTPTPLQQADDFVVMPNGSVGLGTSSPNSSAFLEINVDNLSKGSKKGFLGPRLALTSVSDVTTIPAPAEGLLVYNMGTEPTFNYQGYVFWNGTEWRALNGSSLATGIVGAIKCNNVSLSPGNYTMGQSYSGTMIVPYSAANGGVYPSQTVGPVNGLTATLTGGNFANGDGTLSYTISGTPTVSSPEVTVFPLTIGGKSCNATVGAGDGMAPGDLIFYQGKLLASTTGWMSQYVNDLPILGGKVRLDGLFNASSNSGNNSVTFHPRLVNVTSSPVKIWFSAVTTIDTFNAGNYLMAAGGYVNVDNGIYYGYGYNDVLGSTTPRAAGSGEGGHQEVVQVDLSLDDKWYRIYYFPLVDNKNTTNNTDNERVIYLSIQRLY